MEWSREPNPTLVLPLVRTVRLGGRQETFLGVQYHRLPVEPYSRPLACGLYAIMDWNPLDGQR